MYLTQFRGEIVGPDLGILAEIASLQLEYTYLAKLTQNEGYLNRVCGNTLLLILHSRLLQSRDVMNTLSSAKLQYTNGMFPVQWNITSGEPFACNWTVFLMIPCYAQASSADHLSVGAQADSAHEYLLKLYLLTNKTDQASLKMCASITEQFLTLILRLK